MCKSNVKKLKYFTLIMFCVNTIYVQSQSTNFWDNVRYGGGFGINIGGGFFSGTLAPSAIYQFNDEMFAVGVGASVSYTDVKNDFTSTVFGGTLIGLFNPIRELQVSAEFEQLYVTQRFDDSQFLNERFFLPALYLGVGYNYGNVVFGIKYDVIYDENTSIYVDPWTPFVRVYF